MYQNYFDENKYDEMTEFFINKIAPLGRQIHYNKNELIEVKKTKEVGIILSGQLSQSFYSLRGDELSLFRLEKGTIIGEMEFFMGRETALLTKSVEPSHLSIVNISILEKLLCQSPEIYKNFLLSITRKFNLLMFAMTDIAFNDASGRVASAIIRLMYIAQTSLKYKSTFQSVSNVFTHEELANRLNLNRVTVTRILQKFSHEKLIAIQNRKINILDIDGLEKYVNPLVNEEEFLEDYKNKLKM